MKYKKNDSMNCTKRSLVNIKKKHYNLIKKYSKN